MTDLARLLFPRSIAAIGGLPAHQVVRQNLRLGFQGDIWPIHPRLDKIEGRHAYRNLADLPQAPDAVFLAVNRHASIDVVAQLAAQGAGGVVCYASGFAETGPEGAVLQQRLCGAAGAMPLLGPNCYGVLNYLDGAALWPDQHGGQRVARGVAIVTQSGNIGLNLTMQRRGLPVAFLASLGNQAAVGLSRLVDTLSRDSRISAIGLHVEALDNACLFAEAVIGAAARDVPVVVLKTGSSALGAKLTVSHTASLAGSDAVADAYFRRIGAGRVRTLPELIETLKLLHGHGKLPDGDIVSLSCSGGEAALVADRAEGRRLRLRPFTPAQTQAIAATVPPLVTISNPLDYHTFHWAKREALATTFTAVMQADFALTLLVLDFPRADRCEDGDWQIAADALHDAQEATAKPAAIVATVPECLPEAHIDALMAKGIVAFCGLEEALAAIEVSASLTRGQPVLATPALAAGTTELLDEWRSKQLLAQHGVPIPKGLRVELPDKIRAPGFPAAAKVLGVAHKTDMAALRLNLLDDGELDRAVETLSHLGRSMLIEEMIEPGVELIVGAMRDPAVGLVLVIGSGGVLAELVGDRAILLLPATDADIRRALDSLRVAALLRGYRGRTPADMDTAVETIGAIANFATAHAPWLVELDVNPVIATSRRAVAADALIRMVQPT